jgi:general stress protein 26
MEATNLAERDGLPVIDWARVEPQLVDLLDHDDPQSPDRPTFWLTTLNGDGSPHVTSVGALWHAGSCWFQTGDRTRKARNLARDPRCAVSVATRGFDVMVAGDARRVTDPAVIAEIAALWARSGWPAQLDESGTGITAPFNAPALGPPPWFVYELRPRTATAVGTTEAEPGSTRWRF